jgi:hypothetical protein
MDYEMEPVLMAFGVTFEGRIPIRSSATRSDPWAPDRPPFGSVISVVGSANRFAAA